MSKWQCKDYFHYVYIINLFCNNRRFERFMVMVHYTLSCTILFVQLRTRHKLSLYSFRSLMQVIYIMKHWSTVCSIRCHSIFFLQTFRFTSINENTYSSRNSYAISRHWVWSRTYVTFLNTVNTVYEVFRICKESRSVLSFKNVFSLALHVREPCVTSYFLKTFYLSM